VVGFRCGKVENLGGKNEENEKEGAACPI